MANTKVTGDLIASSTIATGNIADNAVTSDKISGITTAHITEGSNLYYTDARADARVALVVDSAPSTLNTLNELADALGDDPNFATTTATSIGLKAPLASPSFTGNATFAGNITLGRNIDLSSSDYTYIQGTHTGASDGEYVMRTFGYGDSTFYGSFDILRHDTDDGELRLRQRIAGTATDVLSIVDGNSTFGGNVTANGIYSAGQSAIIYKAQRNGGAVASDWSYDDATTDISLGTSTSHSFSLKTGNTRALTINSSQNVGIGTTSPNYRLEVRTTNNNRAIQAVNSTTSGTNWGFQGGAFGSGATKNIGLQVTAEGASTNYAALFEGGNVGIGTTSPNGVKFQTVQTTSGEWTGGFKNYTANGYGLRVDMSNSSSVQSALQVYTGAGTGFVVKNTGNVGIGTFTPNKKLTVYGGNDNGIWVDSSGTRYTSVAWGNNGSEKANIAYDNTNSNFALTAYGASNTIFTNNSSERMRITSGGAILIGQTSNLTSTGTLQVNGMIDQTDVLKAIRMYNGTTFVGGIGSGQWAFGSRPTDYSLYAQNNLLFHAGSGNSIDMMINGSHNVGIGTVSPSNKLEIASSTAAGALTITQSAEVTGNAMVYIDNNSASNKPALRIDVASGGNSTDTHGVLINNNGPGYGLIVNGGNVGIGATAPTRKLDVAGEITHEGLVPKAGAFVDGLLTINKTVSTTANTWTSLDISLSNIGGTGTFAVQVYSDAHGSTNGSWYTMYWSGMMSWHHSNVNATDTDEIPLHAAGHAMNGSTLELRTKLHTADGTSYANRCELQIKTSRALSSAPISFRFRKLL